MQTDLEIAKLLDSAAKTATPVEQISFRQKLALQQSYHIQALSINQRIKRGEQIIGYKLGFTSKAKMDQMGVHEIIWGRLTSSMDLSETKTLKIQNYIHPRVEPEIAFKLKKTIDTFLDVGNVYDYIESVAGAIEIIDSRYKNFKFSLEDVIADNCSSTAFMIGPWFKPDTRISEINISVNIEDDVAQIGNSNDILESPINSLIEMSKLAVKYNIELKAGMIILAGAATPASFLKKGDKVLANFEHLGLLHLKVD